MSQIPFILVTGFLGSGKTTFLKRVLNRYASEIKIGIIQNEFAPANIDGAELKQDGSPFELLEINNGSVFCVCLLSNFIDSLQHFVEIHRPELLILEASGLSDPIAIAQMLDFKDLKKDLYLAKVWTIVDSTSFLKQNKLITRLQHQVRIADVVIINKTDCSTEKEVREIEKEIRALNPFANIIKSSYCDIADGELNMENLQETVAKKMEVQHTSFESCGRPVIAVGVLRSTRSISSDRLMAWIDNYSKKTIRIKGFAKLSDGDGMAIQTSFEQKEFRTIKNFHGSTEIIAMGEGFNLSEFSRNYREIAE